MITTRRIIPMRWRAYFRHPRVRGLTVSVFWTIALFYFVFCTLILVTRWYLLPQVDRFKGDIAQVLSNTLDSQVEIGQIRPRWDTFWPQLELSDVHIHKSSDPSGTSHVHDVLVLPQVTASFYWRTIFGEPLFRHLTVSNAELTVRRLSPTHYDVAGFGFDLATLDTENTPQTEDRSDRTFISWLLNQGRIDITQSSIRYLDLTQTQTTETAVKDINLTFVKNLTDYGFGVQAVLDDGTNNTLDLRAKFSTSVLDAANWRKFTGKIYAAASRIDIARVLKSLTPASEIFESGRGSARMWMDFSDGRINSLTSDVFLRDVTLRFAKRVKPLQYKRFATRLTETWSDNTIRINAHNLRARDANDVELPTVDLNGVFVLDENGQQTVSGNFGISTVDLVVLRNTLDSVPLPPVIADWIRERSPKGHLHDVSVHWTGPVTSPEDWQILGDFQNITIDAQSSGKNSPMVPGVDNLSGRIEIAPTSGVVLLDSKESSVTIPDIFFVPEMKFDHLSGAVSWKMNAESPLVVRFNNIEAANADVKASAHGTWSATGGAGTMNLTGTLEHANASAAWKYMPKAVGQGTQDWLEAGLVAGTASEGQFEVIGPLNKFPWRNSKDPTKEHFYIDLKLNHAAIDYVPSRKRLANGNFERGASWPLLTDINGRLIFEGASMTVKADSARTLQTPVGPTTAVIADLAAHENTTLTVKGQALGLLEDMFRYLEVSPVGGYIGHAFDNTKATGQADLKLHLEIPLLRAKDTRVAGSVKLIDNDITMPSPVPPLTDVEGVVDFTHQGASARGVTARAFGKSDVSANVTTSADGTVTISVSGEADIKNLTFFAPTPIVEETVKHLSGTIPFVSTISIERNAGVTVVAQSNLKGLTSHLPAPLQKNADQAWQTNVSVFPVTVSGKKGLIVRAGSAKHFDVMLKLGLNDAGFDTVGSVSVGTRADLPRRGFAVAINAPKVSLVEWTEPIKSLIDAARKSTSTQAASSTLNAGLTRIDATIDELQTAGDRLKAFRLNVEHTTDNLWAVVVDSDKVSGNMTYKTKDQGSITTELKRVHISKSTLDIIHQFLEEDNISTSSGNNSQVRQLPSLKGSIASFQYENMYFGSVDFDAVATTHGKTEKLDIRNLVVASDAAKLTAQGFWSHTPKKHASNDGQTQLSVNLDLKDTGALLAQLGYPGVIQDAQGSANAQLTYSGSPWNPKLETLAGDMAVNLRKGSFEQIDPGAGGALLSLISFQSLFKRLTLDFTDLTQKGLSFDSFVGSAKIANGVSRSDNTKVATQHGTILISGESDFAKRTLDNHVVFLPDINAGNASLAVAFINPAVGIGTFLAQLFLKEPLSQLFKVEYDITGSWDNPVIQKVGSADNAASKN